VFCSFPQIYTREHKVLHPNDSGRDFNHPAGPARLRGFLGIPTPGWCRFQHTLINSIGMYNFVSFSFEERILINIISCVTPSLSYFI